VCAVDETPHTDNDAHDYGHVSASGHGDRLLGTDEVMARYGLRDRRTARGVMDAAGAFVIGRRLLVREADLVAYEDTLRAARRRRARTGDSPPGRQDGRRHTPTPSRTEPLAPGWWREDAS
jgi:hypothetical protein